MAPVDLPGARGVAVGLAVGTGGAVPPIGRGGGRQEFTGDFSSIRDGAAADGTAVDAGADGLPIGASETLAPASRCGGAVTKPDAISV
jgi:hypothetical protein